LARLERITPENLAKAKDYLTKIKIWIFYTSTKGKKFV